MGGETLDLHSDADILQIQSPANSVGGPYLVVHKDLTDRWAIVAMDWDKEPRLGIRWFWGNGGNPFSSAHPVWLVIPPMLNNGILSGLALTTGQSKKINDFLGGKISGNDLKF
jgi:hypothetical protein